MKKRHKAKSPTKKPRYCAPPLMALECQPLSEHRFARLLTTAERRLPADQMRAARCLLSDSFWRLALRQLNNSSRTRQLRYHLHDQRARHRTTTTCSSASRRLPSRVLCDQSPRDQSYWCQCCHHRSSRTNRSRTRGTRALHLRTRSLQKSSCSASCTRCCHSSQQSPLHFQVGPNSHNRQQRRSPVSDSAASAAVASGTMTARSSSSSSSAASSSSLARSCSPKAQH